MISRARRLETQVEQISKVYECSDYDDQDKVDNIGHILGYDD